jgi:tight adherence protein B
VDELDRAGLRMRPEEWVVFQAAGTVVGGALVAVLFHSVFGLLIGGVGAYAGFRGFLAIKTQRRSTAFIDQMPDTLQLIAGSLRSGFALNQAIVGIVREGTEPTASEFSRALTETRLGAQLEDAMDAVATRMQCVDLHWVVMAIRISREVGGNLAEVLQNTVGTMRDRAQLRGQVKVLSAEGRISARILIGLPFMMAAYLLVFKKGYLNPLVHTGVGIALLSAGSLLLVLGAIWVRKLVKIEV